MTRDELYAALQGITAGNFDELDISREDGEVVAAPLGDCGPQLSALARGLSLGELSA